MSTSTSGWSGVGKADVFLPKSQYLVLTLKYPHVSKCIMLGSVFLQSYTELQPRVPRLHVDARSDITAADIVKVLGRPWCLLTSGRSAGSWVSSAGSHSAQCGLLPCRLALLRAWLIIKYGPLLFRVLFLGDHLCQTACS